MPRNYYYQAVPRSQINWNGDTWKAFLEIRTVKNLDAYCCYADEGIGMILKNSYETKIVKELFPHTRVFTPIHLEKIIMHISKRIKEKF